MIPGISSITGFASMLPFSIAFTDFETINAPGGGWTTSALDIGVAPIGSNKRHVVAAFGFATNNGNISVTVSAVTIGGVSATKIIERLGGGSSGASASIWVAEVPTGTTATVVVTAPNISLAAGVGLYALTNMTTAGVATSSSTSSGTATLSLNVASGDAVIATSGQRDGSSHTWTGLTENYDQDPRSGEWMSTASTKTNTGTPLVITCARSGASDAAACCATFR